MQTSGAWCQASNSSIGQQRQKEWLQPLPALAQWGGIGLICMGFSSHWLPVCACVFLHCSRKHANVFTYIIHHFFLATKPWQKSKNPELGELGQPTVNYDWVVFGQHLPESVFEFFCDRGIFPQASGGWGGTLKKKLTSLVFSLRMQASYCNKIQIQTFFLKSKSTCLVLRPLGKDKSDQMCPWSPHIPAYSSSPGACKIPTGT